MTTKKGACFLSFRSSYVQKALFFSVDNAFVAETKILSPNIRLALFFFLVWKRDDDNSSSISYVFPSLERGKWGKNLLNTFLCKNLFWTDWSVVVWLNIIIFYLFQKPFFFFLFLEEASFVICFLNTFSPPSMFFCPFWRWRQIPRYYSHVLLSDSHPRLRIELDNMHEIWLSRLEDIIIFFCFKLSKRKKRLIWDRF